MQLIRPEIERVRILRGVYEDNRSMRDLHGVLKRKASAQRTMRTKRWIPISVLLIAIAGFGLPVFIHQERKISPVVNVSAAPALSVQGQSAGQNVVANAAEVKSLETGGDIPLGQMLNLGIRRIVLDAGHGGGDPGTVSRGGIKEKNITLSVAMKLRDQLIRQGIADIRMTRTDDSAVSLQERMDYAREAKADMFVSIHVNSLPASNANIIETFYFGPSDDRRSLQLADRENMGSEYGLSDFMEIVERLGKTMKLQESKKLADTIHKTLYRNARELDPDAVDSGVKKAPFVVLMGLDVPSVLAEIACMSNDKAEHDMNLEENQQRIAAALAAGIMGYQNMGVVKNGSK
jgi:N-acetylmuramoyl-L-alanine amidase